MNRSGDSIRALQELNNALTAAYPADYIDLTGDEDKQLKAKVNNSTTSLSKLNEV